MDLNNIPEKYRNNPNVTFVNPDHYTADIDESARHILDLINQRVGGAGESLHDILKYVFDETRNLFHCNRLGLAFLTDDSQRVTAYASVAEYEPLRLKAGYTEDIQNSSLEYILKSGKTRIIHDLKTYIDQYPETRSSKILLHEGVRSSMTCPLHVDDRIVGLFFRSSFEPHSYKPEHVHFQLAIAERLSQAIEKAYRIEQLRDAMKNYGEMLGFISHEIKSPIGATIMECKLMLDNYLGDINPKVRDRLQRIVTRSEHLLGMVRDYLDISRMEGGELKARFTEGVNIQDTIVNPMIDVLQTTADEKGMTVNLNVPSDALTVRCDPDLLKIAVTNFLSNAIKYGRENTPIDINLQKHLDGFRLTVRNEGPGFPKSEIPNLFRKFSRLQTKELLKQKGTGLGLYTVWRIAKLHRGNISADSEEGSWAEFTLTIPGSEME